MNEKIKSQFKLEELRCMSKEIRNMCIGIKSNVFIQPVTCRYCGSPVYIVLMDREYGQCPECGRIYKVFTYDPKELEK